MMGWFEGFHERRFDVNGTAISARFGGRADAPPLLLLHGETAQALRGWFR